MEDCHRYHDGSYAEDSFTVIRQLLSDRILCDVELHVGQLQLPCHRLILASFSSYFRGMFTANMLESKLHQITLYEVDEQAVAKLIDYAYDGRLCITMENVQALIETAVLFDIPKVVEACSQFIIDHYLSVSNCVSVYSFAQLHNLTTLLAHVRTYMIDNFKDMSPSNEFHSLSEDCLLDLLQDSKLNVGNEMEVYQSVVKWIKYDINQRKSSIVKLLRCVRLALFRREQLLELLDEYDELISYDKECKRLIDQALYFQVHPNRVCNIESKPRESYAGLLYVFSYADVFNDYNIVECFNYRDRKWAIKHCSEKKFMSEDFIITVGDRKLYALSGNHKSSHVISNNMTCYDSNIKSWTSIPSVQTPRLEASICELNQLLFVIGGYKIDYNRYTRSSRIAECYDPDTEIWIALSPMIEKRFGSGIATLNGFIYMVGGLSYDSSSTVNFLNSGEYYNPADNTWNCIKCMKYNRYKAGLVALNGFLYAIGGKCYDYTDGSSFVTSSVERYDPEADQWTEVSAMSENRFAAGVTTMGGRIWAVGGKSDEDNVLASGESYDPFSGEWEKISPMCNKGYNLCAVNTRHEIFY